MDIIIKKLVHQQYDCDDIIMQACPNCLKDTNDGEVFEINAVDNTKHTFSEDISKHDLVIEIKDESDSYMFFFVNIQESQDGNKRYVIEKIVIDEGLTEKCIAIFSNYAITTFINGDATTKHYLYTDKQYPFYSHTLKEITPIAIDSIIQSYKAIKYGWHNSLLGEQLIQKLRSNS